MTLDALVHSPALEALAWSLLHFVWQGAAIAALYAIFLPALARQTADARHRAACVALLAMAVAPIATFLLLLPSAAHSVAIGAALPAAPARPADVLRLALLGGWAGGVAFFAMRLAGGLAHLRRLARIDTAPLDARWIAIGRRLAATMGASPRIAFLSSPHVSVPMAFGWLAPVVLVPLEALTAMPHGYLEALLAHEIAHLRRRDFLVNVLQSAVESVLFYHPAVWWLSARIREEREYACDDLATAVLDDRLVYAHALTSLEELRRSRPALALPSNGGPLMRRIRRLLAPPPVPSRARAWTAPLVLAVALVPFAAAAVGAAMAPATKSEPATAIRIAWMPPVVEPWRDEIAKAAATHGVDPELLAILVLVESAGNPDALSTGGAVGLLQVMPATGKRIADARGLAGYEPAQLRDPAYNLDAGAWYLAQQFADFGAGLGTDDAVELAAAAYNGGPRALKESLAGTGDLSAETKRYRALVSALWKERRADRSLALDAWRGRALARVEGRTVDPLPGARVSLPFQAITPDLGGGSKVHEGVDLAAANGSDVRAPLAGLVRIATTDGGDEGTIVVIDHGKGLETRFHHLGELRVAAGEKIAAGAVLGTVGTTGKTTGPHVHFEVRDIGRPVDPLLLLP